MIRSVIVPVSNIASNVLQLMTNGVGVRDIAKSRVKLVEINQHLKNEARKVEIEAEMSQYGPNNVRRKRLEAEKKALEDASRRMSIWPMIEAGEFSTISEGLTEADAAISQGKWIDHIRDITDRVPEKLGTLGKYAMVTRDTALFQGMNRAIQYGDFLAKGQFPFCRCYSRKPACQPGLPGNARRFLVVRCRRKKRIISRDASGPSGSV